jgi:hypothetical protein
LRLKKKIFLLWLHAKKERQHITYCKKMVNMTQDNAPVTPTRTQPRRVVTPTGTQPPFPRRQVSPWMKSLCDVAHDYGEVVLYVEGHHVSERPRLWQQAVLQTITMNRYDVMRLVLRDASLESASFRREALIECVKNGRCSHMMAVMAAVRLLPAEHAFTPEDLGEALLGAVKYGGEDLIANLMSAGAKATYYSPRDADAEEPPYTCISAAIAHGRMNVLRLLFVWDHDAKANQRVLFEAYNECILRGDREDMAVHIARLIAAPLNGMMQNMSVTN